MSSFLVVANAEQRVIGLCGFDVSKMAFQGAAVEQAQCLLRPVNAMGKIGPLRGLPDTLQSLVGRPFSWNRTDVSARLAELGLPKQLASTINREISHGRTSAGVRFAAAYFVIHDTSQPYIGDAVFPNDLDSDLVINDLSRYANSGAHVFVNRLGDIYVAHDFAIPWRATQLESALGAGVTTKGLFVHVELVQPRRRLASAPGRNDASAPNPGFSPVQYGRLAQLYVLASARAGIWLIPAFHAVIDSGMPNGHDDPQNFDLAQFDAAISATLRPLLGQH